MKSYIKTVLLLIFSLSLMQCAQKQDKFHPKKLYQSKDLTIAQIAENSFLHTSFKQTDEFGNVPCNGLIVRNSDEVIIFDTPTNDKNSQELIQWIKGTLHCKINAIIPTHFHDDCLGGLKAFHENTIPSYANFKTIELAKENNLVTPKNSFKDSLVLKVGTEKISAKFLGEGHTKDNIVGYFPSDNILFGGCLIKAMNATKGFTGDGNLAEWSNTVEKVKKHYPKLNIIVPGHGDYGNIKLLDYTIALFKSQ